MKNCCLVMLASLFMFSQFGHCGSTKKTSGSQILKQSKRSIVYFSDDNVPIPIKRTKDIIMKKSTVSRTVVARK